MFDYQPHIDDYEAFKLNHWRWVIGRLHMGVDRFPGGMYSVWMTLYPRKQVL